MPAHRHALPFATIPEIAGILLGTVFCSILFFWGQVTFAQKGTVAQQEASHPQPAPPAEVCLENPEPGPIAPRPGEVFRLFNGRDLTGWSTWLKGIGSSDPQRVYSAVDGCLRISGHGMGYVATDRAYRDYHLSLEYRWGKKTDGSGYVRNSGILLHATGPDGNARGVWMASLECQLAQGCEGDLIVIQGNDITGAPIPVTITGEVSPGEDGKPRWQPGGKKTVYSGRQFWWSRHQAGFEERVDTRGRDDVASPLGQWTQVECLCRGGEVTIRINGVTVNHCEAVHPQAGKILLENEGNEIYFRNIELRGL